ncbi:unnamed protein product [Amoebophrya sp. A25]|nr:unnamed protein product [Amoebophrya sp. A25]|eukprot:GSA25T00016975001.1
MKRRVALGLGLSSHAVVGVLSEGTIRSPLAKVLALLKKMQSEVEKDMESDAAISKKLQCWAATNRKEKEAAIALGESTIKETEAKISDLTAQTASLDVTVKKLAKDLAEDEEQLKTIEDKREKDAAKFTQYQKDTIQAIQQLTGALMVLKKHQGKRFLEVRRILERNSDYLPQSDLHGALSLLDSGLPAHASASGEIYGILSQMQETMQAELKTAQAEEADGLAAFENLRKAKREEIAAGRSELHKNKEALARGLEELARSKKLLKETKDTLEADKVFLADVNERAAADKKELEARVAAQAEEMKALQATVDVLTSDEARDQFNKTLKPTFLQISSRKLSSLKQKAAQLLRSTKSGEKFVAMLQAASGTQLAAFEEVKKKITDLIAELKKKKGDEVKKREYCLASFDENDKETTQTKYLAEDLTGKQTNLENAIETLIKTIETTEKEISDLQIEIATATENRKDENKEYQTVFSDQKITQKILVQAKSKLKSFYEPGEPALLETSQPGGPVGLEAGGYKKKNGVGIIGMIDEIITDSEQTIGAALIAEKDAQGAYEKFIADSSKDLADLEAQLNSALESKAESEADLHQTKADIKAAMERLEELAEALKALHMECDFTVQNFDQRQAAFTQEAEALAQAIAILSGAS